MTHPTMQRVFDKIGETSTTEIARKINTNPQNIQNWVKRGVSKSGAVSISQTYGIDLNWILTGQGEPHLALQANVSPNFLPIEDWDSDTPLEDDEVAVPFYKDFSVACGHGTDGIAYENEWRRLRMSRATIERIGSYRDKIFATLADGDSMTPTINDGDTIWVDMSKENIKDGKIFVFEYGGLFMCKRLYRLPNNGLRVVSDNSDVYPEWQITGEQKEQNGFKLIGWVWHWSVMERW